MTMTRMMMMTAMTTMATVELLMVALTVFGMVMKIPYYRAVLDEEDEDDDVDDPNDRRNHKYQHSTCFVCVLLC